MADSDTELLIDHDAEQEVVGGKTAESQRTLNTFFGVIVPCCLSMFSVVLFLRMGFIIGQAGLLQALIMLVVAFSIIALTVTSICAISTNGAVEAGGAYFMISRALGPELGASIGLMFFLANAAAVAMYIFGMCETIIDDFGPGGQLLANDTSGIPAGQWVEYGYGTLLLFLVGTICLVGADIYAKATFGIFIMVGCAIISVIISFFVERAESIKVINPDWPNRTELYTGFSSATFHENLYANYTTDYTIDNSPVMGFISVFAILFNGCTGIMAGANMSGELRNPSKSIPVGTIVACCVVCFTYILLMFLIGATCPKALLNNNYTFLQAISFWPPLVFIGIFLSSFSAALSCLIGASRVLYAMSCDGMFGSLLKFTRRTDKKGNPFVAVLVTWFIVQLVLLVGKLNAIAPLVTIFFLLAYTACDLACFGLDWASAPNFRPTFKYFSWHTALLGTLSTIAVMILVNYIWALVAIAIAIILSAISHYTAPRVAWGSISQALIFHQVRKYALKINIRDESVDAWRPGILFLVSDIVPNLQSILFVNDLKKSGLLVIGKVNVGKIDDEDHKSSQRRLDFWCDFVKEQKIKAFVEHTTCPTLRLGAEQLLRLSGLGGMKANTLVLNIDQDVSHANDIINDALCLERNVVLLRSIESLNRQVLQAKGARNYIDVWTRNVLDPVKGVECSDEWVDLDASALFLLQLACLLSRSHSWRDSSVLRTMVPISAGADEEAIAQKFRHYLTTLRIKSEVVLVRIERQRAAEDQSSHAEYAAWVNSLLLSRHLPSSLVTFLQLPPSIATSMDLIRPNSSQPTPSILADLGPCVLAHGLRNVISR